MRKYHSIFDIFIFEPFKQINHGRYLCDSKFHIDNIIEMYNNDIVNGAIFVDGKECSYYTVNGIYVKKIKENSLHLQKKFGRGGSSMERLRRVGELIRNSYVNNIIETIISLFYDKKINKPKVDGIIICGPANLKLEIAKSDVINQYFKQIHILSLQNFDNSVVIDFFKNIENPQYCKNLDMIQNLISLGDDRLVFGDDIYDFDKSVGTLYIDANYDSDYIDRIIGIPVQKCTGAI